MTILESEMIIMMKEPVTILFLVTQLMPNIETGKDSFLSVLKVY